MNLRITLISMICLGAFIAKGQTNSESSAVPFIGIVQDARSAAMGGVGTATTPDAWSVYRNAAKSVFSTHSGAIAYSYSPWMKNIIDDSRLQSLAAYYKLNDKQAIVAGFRHFANGKFEMMDESGMFTGNISPKEFTIDLGYSRVIADGLSAALTAHYICSDMGKLYGDKEIANAVAFDLGIYYQQATGWLEGKSSWSAGLNLTNFGSKISYLDEKYNLPGKMNFGAALNLPFSANHFLMLAGDLGYQLIPSGSKELDGALGAEYRLFNILSLRTGYHWGDSEKGGSDYFTVGGGLQYYHFHADFSYWLADKSTDALDKTLHFTLGMDFDIFKKNRK